jgi:hypothetical protein
VEQGSILDAHDDIPDNVRDQLYAEERQRLSKQKSLNKVFTGPMIPHINIDVLQMQSSQTFCHVNVDNITWL